MNYEKCMRIVVKRKSWKISQLPIDSQNAGVSVTPQTKPNQTKPNQTIPCRKLNIVYGVIHRKPKGLEDQQPHKQNPHFQSIRVHVIRKYIIFGYASFLLLLLEKMKPTAYQ